MADDGGQKSWGKGSVTLFETDASREAAQKTFIVFGHVRGGTTSVAGCLRVMGIFMGDKLPVNLEDPAFHNKAQHKMKTVAERNKAYDVWGWKYPAATRYLDRISGKLRNPRLIYVTRDLAANAVGVLGRHEDFTADRAMRDAFATTVRNQELVQKMQAPTLFLSYEKMLVDTQTTIEQLADFLNIGAGPEDIARAVEFIQPGRYAPAQRSAPAAGG